MGSHTAEVITGPMSTGKIGLRSAAEVYLEGVERWCRLVRLAGSASADDVRQLLADAPRLIHIPSDVASTADATWLEPVLEFGVVPRTVAVLEGIPTAFQHLTQRGAGGDRGAAPAALTADASAAWLAARPLANALEVLEMCAIAVVRTACPVGTAAGAVQTLQLRLLKQLAADETVQAVARSLGFVQQHLWPSLASAGGRDGSDGAGASHDSVSGSPREDPQQSSSSRDRAELLGGHALGSAAAFVYRIMEAAQLARSAESATLSVSDPDHVAAETQRVVQRFLESLAESGLMSHLSSALLAAPPWQDVPPGAEVVHNYTKAIAVAQRKILGNMLDLAECNNRAYLESLLSPEVRKLQWTLLEQVAATAEDVAAAAGTARDSAGGGAGGGAAAVKQRWPLLQRQALRLLFGTTLQINEVMHDCIKVITNPAELDINVEAFEAYVEGVFPTRGSAAALGARVCAAVHARLQSLGPAGAQPRPGARVTPQDLVTAADHLRELFLFRIVNASVEDQTACLPDLLAMVAWVMASWATPAGLQEVRVEHVEEVVKSISTVLQGSIFATSVLLARRGRMVTPPEMPAFLWRQLNSGTRAACLQRLLPINLPRVLDQLLRAVAAAEKGDSVLHPAMVIHTSLAELIGPLLRMRLVRCRVQQQLQQQTRTQPEGQQQPGVSSSNAAAAGSPGGGWRAEEELGLVLTALKLLRREAPPRSVQGAAAPGLLSGDGSAHFALTCFVLQLGGADYGLPALLPELLKATRDGGSVAAGGESGLLGSGTADVVMVAQAVAACGLEGLRHLTPLLEQTAEAVGGGGGSGREEHPPHPAAAGLNKAELCDYGIRMLTAAEAVWSAVRHSPVEVLLQAQPQRALAAIGQMLLSFQQQWRRQGASWGQQVVDGTQVSLMKAVVLLSAEERLLSGCVPGWLWAAERGVPPGRSGAGGGRRGGGRDPETGWVLNEAALAALCGPGDCIPQEGPVLVMTRIASVQLGSQRWADHGLLVAEVAALAREAAKQLGLMDGRALQLAAEAGGGGGPRVALWPPRLLRLCGNPCCANFGGASEAELDLKKCSGCGAVRYCGKACQLQHWRTGHRQECEQQQAVAAAGGGE